MGGWYLPGTAGSGQQTTDNGGWAEGQASGLGRQAAAYTLALSIMVSITSCFHFSSPYVFRQALWSSWR